MTDPAARRATCSCGRDEVELGCDLCRYCRADYEERQMERERESFFDLAKELPSDAR